MKKVILLVAVLLVFVAGVVYADHEPGHLGFPDLPFLSETAMDDDPSGAVPICFSMDLGTTDSVLVPDFKIRIISVWINVEVADQGECYFMTDGLVGNDITNCFATSSTGYQAMRSLNTDFWEIDPAAGESITVNIDAGAETAEAHLYFLATRIL